MSANWEPQHRGRVATYVWLLFVGMASALAGCPAQGPQAPSVGSFAINNGAATTAGPTVTLASTCAHAPAEYIAAETSNFAGAAWQPYAAQVAFNLSAGAGEKTVHFKVRNAAGESAAVSDTIILAPTAVPSVTSFALNGGAASTPHAHVALNASCEGGPTEYLASEAADFAGASWQPYAANPAFSLSPGLGVKTVYFKVRNALGESAAVSDAIERVEQLTPEVTAFALAQGAQRTATRAVTLDNTATGAPTEYLASESAAFAGAAWQPYAPAPSFTLSSGLGLKTVYFKTRNAHGESATVSDQIERATSALPEMTGLSINNGASFTAEGTVTLNNTCANAPTEYLASETPDFAGAAWRPYSAAPAFELTAGEGLKTVYVKMRNAYGESSALSDTITFGLPAPPEVTSFALNNAEASTASRTVTLNNTCAHFPTEYMASESATFLGASWLPYAAAPVFQLSSGNRVKEVYFKTRNAFGESEAVSDTIALQALPVLASFALNGGRNVTFRPTVTLDHSCSGSTTAYRASESPSFHSAEWKPYTNTPSFDLSSGNGTKTVYFQVRNAYGDSNILSDAIQLERSTYVFDRMWPELPQPWYFGDIRDAAVDAVGNLYVADYWRHCVKRFTGDGVFLTEWGGYGTGDGQFIGPRTIALDRFGNVYVADSRNGRIQKFGPGGTYLTQWEWPEWLAGTSTGPFEIAVSDLGNVYALYRYSGDVTISIIKFGPDGTILGGWSTMIQPSPLSRVDLAVDGRECVYAAVISIGALAQPLPSYAVHKYGPDGKLMAEWGIVGNGEGQIRLIGGIAFDNCGTVYVSDSWKDQIVAFTSEGEFVGKWGAYGANNGQFMTPTDLAVDAQGNIFVVDGGNARIQKFALKMGLQTEWKGWEAGPRRLSTTDFATTDVAGNLSVTDENDLKDRKIVTGPEFVDAWSGSGRGAGLFRRPSSVAVDASRNVYVSDTFNHCIQKFTTSGAFITQWGAYGSNNGQFRSPASITVDKENHVHVADSQNFRIQKFTSDGVFLSCLELEFEPYSLAVDDSLNLYVASGNTVFKFSPTGVLLTHLDSADAEHNWSHVADVTTDRYNNVYVINWFSNCIQKFSAEGTYLTQWGSKGSNEGQFLFHHDYRNYREWGFIAVQRNPLSCYHDCISTHTEVFAYGCLHPLPSSYAIGWGSGLATDVEGNVYVADFGNSRIQKFTSDGAYITQFGSRGWANDQFGQVADLAVDTAGNVYVADFENNRIQKFRPE